MKFRKDDVVFLSFAYTGQDQAVIEQRMKKLYDMFTRVGIKTYCNLYDDNCKEFTLPGEFVCAAIEELKSCTKLVAIVASDHRSQGQLMEIGAAIALNLPVVTLMNESAKGSGYIEDPHISLETYYWHTDDQLLQSVNEMLIV